MNCLRRDGDPHTSSESSRLNTTAPNPPSASDSRSGSRPSTSTFLRRVDLCQAAASCQDLSDFNVCVAECGFLMSRMPWSDE